MNCDLLVRVFGRSAHFDASGAVSESEALSLAETTLPDVALVSSVLGCDPEGGIKTAKKLLDLHPTIKVVMVLDGSRREEVIESFRAGAVGIFSRNSSTKLLCKCASCVSSGEVWANSSQIKFALEALTESPHLRIADNSGKALLTERQMQIIRYLADGLTNREIAAAMKLSEHTVKNYMLRIFDKLGVSTRVEVVLYALSHLAQKSSH